METEVQIRAALDSLMNNRTTFIIAHRIQSIMNADLILVFDKGKIVQMGEHEVLLNQDGIYRTFTTSRLGLTVPCKRKLTVSNQYNEEELDDVVDLKSGVVGRLMRALKPYWPQMLLAIIGIASVSYLDAYYTVLNKRIIDEGIVARNLPVMIGLFRNYAIVVLAQTVGFFLMIFIIGRLGEQLRYDFRKKLFHHLQNLSLSYFSKTPLGWIMSRVTSDTEKMADLLTWGVLDTVWAVTNISFAVFFMLQLNAALAVIVIISLPVMIFVSFKFRVKIYHHYRQSRKANSKMTASLNENITGVRIVKALRREAKNLDDFKVLSTNMYQESYRAVLLSAIYLPTIQTISAISLVLILWRGGLQVASGAITIGVLQAFISYIMMILWPIQDLARVYAEMQNAIASSERVFSLLDMQPEIRNREDLLPVDSLAGDVEFEDVSFHYEDDEPVIKNLSFHIPQGQTVALVGTTGGGKTTIVNLLCRFIAEFRCDSHRWARLHAVPPRGHSIPHRGGSAGSPSLLRQHPRQPALWASGCKRRRN